MKEPTATDRRHQALHALNCAIACMVAWPPDERSLGSAVFFTALALHRLAQADVDGAGADHAEQLLVAERNRRTGAE
jgi:hypothetical protein